MNPAALSYPDSAARLISERAQLTRCRQLQESPRMTKGQMPLVDDDDVNRIVDRIMENPDLERLTIEEKARFAENLARYEGLTTGTSAEFALEFGRRARRRLQWASFAKTNDPREAP
jgi:hypothetical protein